jgi:thioesterase domain-containing protein
MHLAHSTIATDSWSMQLARASGIRHTQLPQTSEALQLAHAASTHNCHKHLEHCNWHMQQAQTFATYDWNMKLARASGIKHKQLPQTSGALQLA